MSRATTATGKTLTLDQLSNAEAAIRRIAENNRAWLEHYYGTSADDVEATAMKSLPEAVMKC